MLLWKQARVMNFVKKTLLWLDWFEQGLTRSWRSAFLSWIPPLSESGWFETMFDSICNACNFSSRFPVLSAGSCSYSKNQIYLIRIQRAVRWKRGRLGRNNRGDAPALNVLKRSVHASAHRTLRNSKRMILRTIFAACYTAWVLKRRDFPQALSLIIFPHFKWILTVTKCSPEPFSSSFQTHTPPNLYFE